MHTELIAYSHDQTSLEGYLAYDDSKKGHRPAILIAHDWTGRNEFACEMARRLAEQGYVGFALDMFGKGILGNTKEEKMALIQPFMSNRDFLLQRMMAAFNTITSLPAVDRHRIATIGFCFGGLCALDLARSGAPIKSVVSFHGLLNPPHLPKKSSTITAKILALHGHDDPMVPPEQVLAFQQEMTTTKADWQMNIYGNTMHAFTNPAAHDHAFGTVYNEKIASRAFMAMEMFFEETL